MELPEVFAVIDTETGGLDPKTDALLSVGVVVVNTRLDSVIKSREWTIQPHKDLKVCERALRVQGLTWADMERFYQEGDTEEDAAIEIYQTLTEYLGYDESVWRKSVFAFNSDFDAGFLMALSRRTTSNIQLERSGYQGWRCARQLYLLLQTLGVCPPGEANLSAAIAALLPGEERPVKHEALADAMLTAKFVDKSLRILTGKGKGDG